MQEVCSYGSLHVDFEFVDHINMFVKNLEESIEFYQKIFGTDGEIKDFGKRGIVRWCIIGIPRKFYFCFYEIGDKTFEPDEMHINHIGFYVSDFEETFRRIQKLNVPIEYKGKPIRWTNRNGNSNSLYIRDPNGYIIEFSEKVGGGLD